MTKKDFEILAQEIRRLAIPSERLSAAAAVAAACARINPRFKPDVFFAACGV
jgi:hypothetical protein